MRAVYKRYVRDNIGEEFNRYPYQGSWFDIAVNIVEQTPLTPGDRDSVVDGLPGESLPVNGFLLT